MKQPVDYDSINAAAWSRCLELLEREQEAR